MLYIVSQVNKIFKFYVHVLTYNKTFPSYVHVSCFLIVTLAGPQTSIINIIGEDVAVVLILRKFITICVMCIQLSLLNIHIKFLSFFGDENTTCFQREGKLVSKMRVAMENEWKWIKYRIGSRIVSEE